jgi:biotin carboxylase
MELETHVFAWEDGAVAAKHCDHFYPISIRESCRILKTTRRIQPDGVLSIGSDLAAVTVNFVATELGLVGNSLQSTLNTTNKYTMRQVLKRHGLPCPRFRIAPEGKWDNFEDLRLPLIVKPTDRSGSRGVTKVEDRSRLDHAIQRARDQSLSGDVIVEEFVEGYEVSVEAISWEGRHYLLALTDKETTGAPYFVEMGHHQPAIMGEEIASKVWRVVERALTSLGVCYGASHSEILLTANGDPYIVEIGARMGGDLIGSHLVQLSTGYDFLRGVIEVALGDFSGVTKGIARCSGVHYLTASPGVVQSIEDHTDRFPEIIERSLFVEPAQRIGALTQSADRVGYYVYCSASRFRPVTPPLAVVTA